MQNVKDRFKQNQIRFPFSCFFTRKFVWFSIEIKVIKMTLLHKILRIKQQSSDVITHHEVVAASLGDEQTEIESNSVPGSGGDIPQTEQVVDVSVRPTRRSQGLGFASSPGTKSAFYCKQNQLAQCFMKTFGFNLKLNF